MPGWRTDRIELRLRPAAARLAVPFGARTAAGGAAAGRLGVPALDAFAASLGVRLVPEFAGETPPPPGSGGPDFTAYAIATLPPGLDLADALARFAALPDVALASPIAVAPVAIVGDDSLMTQCTWLYQPSRHDIHAPEAWDVTTGDTTVVVAVLDTGVLPYHPDLGGSVAGLSGNLFVNWAEKGGLPGVDDDHNGFVDDVSGWDFVNLGGNANVVPGEDWRDADNDPNDFAGHGTAVAGLIGAITDNSLGIAGTTWKVRLLPVRVGWADISFPLGLVDMSYVAQGLRYATIMGASVVNCSFSTVDQPGLTDAALAAVRAGVTIVLSAGNGGQSQVLGQLDPVLAVSAVDGSDVVAPFSNLGPWVDVAAPGVGLASTWLTHVTSDSIGLRQPAYSTTLSGTSFSAPQVTGAVALLQAYRRAHGLKPLTPLGMVLRVRDTADDISALNTPGLQYGTGRLDLYRLLTDRTTSLAVRAGALTVGPPVALPQPSGYQALVYTTSDQHLLFVDGNSLDTLRVAALGGRPARQLAAADMGGGRGVRLYAGLTSGKLAGFDASGNALPGFPVAGPGVLYPLSGGPALGDIDGDGVLDVVCGAADGSVWAWSADGALKPGFPVALGGASVSLPVAVAPLGGGAAASIVALADDATLHVIEGDGSERAGFPVALAGAPVAPVVARFDAGRDPLILAATGGTLHAIRADGSSHFAVPLGGAAAQDPALADLDGDLRPEIVVALASPSVLAAFDSTGAPLAARGWPFALPAAPAGPPLIGHFLGGPRAAALVMTQTAGLAACDDSAHAVGRFPMPGGAGLWPTLGDFDADGATEVAAGTSPDSMLLVYDAGAGTRDPAPEWFTPRGDFARSGAVAARPTALAVGAPPAAHAALALAARGRPARVPVTLAWSAPAGALSALQLFDVAGRRVRTLGTGAGDHGVLQWDGRNEGGALVPAGLYFARLTCGSLHVQTRVVLLP